MNSDTTLQITRSKSEPSTSNEDYSPENTKDIQKKKIKKPLLALTINEQVIKKAQETVKTEQEAEKKERIDKNILYGVQFRAHGSLRKGGHLRSRSMGHSTATSTRE
jgi:hypothetical protein